mmetsp:Transcript_43764/g.103412  ORF Transcript_43764/g.103412 Transcript_43764/m.103412 type:complete len:221 (-) Transcript_43764:2141-2803(-)
MWRLAWSMGRAPDFVSPSSKSNAASFSNFCSLCLSVDSVGLASKAFCARFVHVSDGVMMVGRRALSVSNSSNRLSISCGTCVKSRSAPSLTASPSSCLCCCGASACWLCGCAAAATGCCDGAGAGGGGGAAEFEAIAPPGAPQGGGSAWQAARLRIEDLGAAALIFIMPPPPPKGAPFFFNCFTSLTFSSSSSRGNAKSRSCLASCSSSCLACAIMSFMA